MKYNAMKRDSRYIRDRSKTQLEAACLSSEEAFERAEEIRDLWTNHGYNQYGGLSKLADLYGISVSYTKSIVENKKCFRIEPPSTPDGKDIILDGIRYKIYVDGSIWSYALNRFKIDSDATGDYKYFYTEPNGNRSSLNKGKRVAGRKHRVHHLVIETFGPPRPGWAQVVRHLNDIKGDNRIENLAWGTFDDNYEDRIANGLVKKGQDNHASKMTDDLVRELITTYTKGSLAKHAKWFRKHCNISISVGTLVSILKGKRWSHVVPGFTGYKSTAKEACSKKMVMSVIQNWNSNEHTGCTKKVFSKRLSEFYASKGIDISAFLITRIINGERRYAKYKKFTIQR